jgi:predicted PurR-regulated permease PerM
VFKIVGSVLRLVTATITVAVLATFMLLFGGPLFASLLRWVPPGERTRVDVLAGRMRRSVGGYVSGTLLVAAVGGVVTTLALLILGVPYFLPLGLLMGVLGVIPFVGAALGGILVVGTTFLASGLKAGLVALLIFVLYQQAENHLLQPLIQRKTIRMNPLAIALVMLVGTAFAGILGALLALPVAAATKIVLDEVLVRRRSAWPEPPSSPTESTLPAAPPGATAEAETGS